MNIIEKARILESRCNAFIAGLPELKFDTYLFFLMCLFFITGLVLFFYALVFNIPIMLISTLSNPLFHLGMGFCCSICFIAVRWGVKNGFSGG